MKRRVRNVLKSLKNINIVKRNIQGNRLYVFPIGDVSFRQEFTEEDLAGIELLGSNDLINPTMFEYAVCDKVGNEYALMDRGVLNGVATGADLGMYNYDLITDTLPEEDLIYEVAEDDYEFEYCMLAEENPLMGTETKVIHTFRGYLEVTMPQEKFSIIRKSVFDSKEESIVYMPQGYVKKYQLRHGDEIVCTYIEDKGKLLMNSLFTINGIYYKDWETDRPCVEELTISREGVCVETEEPCLGVIAKKYKLYQGDSAFVYINKNTSKTQVANLADEFPEIKDLINPETVVIKTKDLRELINRSIFSVATDDARPILKGCLFEISNDKITAVALDGYRLALAKKPIKSTTAEFSCIIPARTLGEISKLLEGDDEDLLELLIQKNYLMIDLNDTRITTRLLDGDYLNYNQIIPSSFSTTLILNKNQLEDALERASLLSRVEKNNLVKFEITDKVMVLSSKSELGDIKENITISLTGNDLAIAFNARYFTEALRVTSDEFLKLKFTSPIAPCVITGNESDEFLYLILPVRIV